MKILPSKKNYFSKFMTIHKTIDKELQISMILKYAKSSHPNIQHNVLPQADLKVCL